MPIPPFASPLLQWLISVVVAVWVLWQFVLRREAEPGAELQIDAVFHGRQNGQWLIEAVATLANRGNVRNRYRNFTVTIRYLLPEDEIRDGDARIHYQLQCDRCIDERIGGARRTFANAVYIDPRLTFRHSYITFVPETATFVWIQCRMDYRSWWHFKKKNGQRLFRVPAPGG